MELAPHLTVRKHSPPCTLIVDRDPDTRKLYADYLRRAAWQTDEAEDGREALAKALTHHPDVIVTDTRLPGMSGLDLCALLRRDASTASIPIVVVTADAFDADVRRAKAAGADSVLLKPCLPETLAAELSRVFEVSADLRARARAVREKLSEQLARSEALMERSRVHQRRTMLSRAHNRRNTTDPPLAAPTLVCPVCDVVLRYQHSHVGGVSERHSEQWDYFDCASGCGTFQYRHRTRKLRKV
jgi:CheY-like chemotaxis protein